MGASIKPSSSPMLAADQHEIAFFGHAALHLALQRGGRGSVRPITSKPDVSLSRRCTMPGRRSPPASRSSGKRASSRSPACTRVAGRRVYDHAGGLVDHDHSLIDKHDLERHIVLGR